MSGTPTKLPGRRRRERASWDTIGMLAFRLWPDGRLDRTFAPQRRR